MVLLSSTFSKGHISKKSKTFYKKLRKNLEVNFILFSKAIFLVFCFGSVL